MRLIPAIEFSMRHPELLVDALLLSLCSSLGQLVIYQTVKEFGALVYSTIMTTRQLLSILLSSLVFMHPLKPIQWIGAIGVLLALYTKALQKKTRKSEFPSSPPSQLTTAKVLGP